MAMIWRRSQHAAAGTAEHAGVRVVEQGNEVTATPSRVVLAGGSRFLGQSLAEALVGWGYDPVVLSRTPSGGAGGVRTVAWDGRTVGDWAEELEGAAAVVNLAGRSVDCRYTATNRRLIVDSRLHSVAAIGEAIRGCRRPPGAWVQAGSLAIYGDAGDRLCTEESPHGSGFGAEVCELWEAAFAAETTSGTRKSLLRIGFALGPDGGALTPLARLARWGLGGTVGNGRQYISWLHVDDLNLMWRAGIERAEIEGAYNATGPSPCTNRVFMATLRRTLGRPWSPQTPAVAVHLGAFFMRTEPSLALTGRRCVPARFAAQGVECVHTDLDETLRSVLTPGT